MAYNKTVKLRSMQLLISLTNCCLEAVCIAFYLERTRFYSQKILEEENGTPPFFIKSKWNFTLFPNNCHFAVVSTMRIWLSRSCPFF